jgi:hypothetical protein
MDLANQDIAIVPIDANQADLDFHMWAVWDGEAATHHVKHFMQLLEERVQGATNLPPLESDVVSIRDYQTAI